MTHKDWWRRFGVERHAELLRSVGTLPANVMPLPRRIRDFATWAEFIASYGPKPPAQVLAFVRPPPERQPQP